MLGSKMEPQFGEIVQWTNPLCTPFHGSFSAIHPISWYSCRETFAELMEVKGFKSLYFCTNNKDKTTNVAQFIYRTEQILNLEQKSTYQKTTFGQVMKINLSDFWLSCFVRKSLFTLLLRVGCWYNHKQNNYYSIINEPPDFIADGYHFTIPAIMKFLAGNTVYNGFLNTNSTARGWCKLFKEPSSLEWLSDKVIVQSEEKQIEAVRENGNLIQSIKDPSEKVQLEAVKQKSCAIIYIKNPTEKVQLEAAKNYGDIISSIKNPSETVKIAAIKQNGLAIQYIKNPTEEMKLLAVKSSGSSIAYISNPTEEMKLEAVKNSGNAIRYIPDPSEKVQLEAVKQDGLAISNILFPSKKIQLAAVTTNISAIHHINSPSEKVQLIVVKQNPDYIRFFSNCTEKVQLEAVKLDPESFRFIVTPTKKVKEFLAQSERTKNETTIW